MELILTVTVLQLLPPKTKQEGVSRTIELSIPLWSLQSPLVSAFDELTESQIHQAVELEWETKKLNICHLTLHFLCQESRDEV